jgi:hypothetical protein
VGLDILCLPLLGLIALTVVRLPRLLARWEEHFGQSRGAPRQVGRLGKLNSWKVCIIFCTLSCLLLSTLHPISPTPVAGADTGGGRGGVSGADRLAGGTGSRPHHGLQKLSL